MNNQKNFNIQDDAEEKRVAFLRSARLSFIILGAATVIGNVLLLTKLSTSFLFFSSWSAYFFLDYAMAYCLKFPVESYGDAYQKYAENALPESVFIVAIIVGFVIGAIYILLFALSFKENKITYIAGLVLTAIDTGMIFASLKFIPFTNTVTIAILFHAILVFQQVMGVRSVMKKQK